MSSRWPAIIYGYIVEFYLIIVVAFVTITIYAIIIILLYIQKYMGLVDISNKIIENKELGHFR